MKRGLALIMMFLDVVLSSAQDREICEGFIWTGSELIWQRVYEYVPADSLSIRNWFHDAFGVTRDEPDVISGQYVGVLPIEACGIKRGSSPIFIGLYKKFNFRVEFRECRYRVTVLNMQYSDGLYDPTEGFGLNSDLSGFAIRRGSFTKHFLSKSGPLTDRQLDYSFHYKDVVDENW